MKLSKINTTPNFKALNFNKALNGTCVYFDAYSKKESQSALDFLKNTKMSPDSVFKFLCHITANNKTSDCFVKEVSSNPRSGEKIKIFLIDKMNGSNPASSQGHDMFMTWFHNDTSGYRAAYQKYYDYKFWDKTSDLNALVKQSPNLSPWALLDKTKSLRKDIIFGKPPEDFGTIKEYRQLIDKLKHSDFYNAYVKTRNLQVYSSNNDSMDAMTIANARLKELSHPVCIKTNSKAYTVTPIIRSFSSKLIYEVANENDKTKKFILKFDPYQLKDNTDMAVKFSENQDLRPDMPYINSMIDFYLKENKSPNAADILLYDHNTKSALYRATKGDTPTVPDKYLDNLYLFINYNKIKDIKKLGVELSDAHIKNFIEDENGILRLVDPGHARYSNVFRPPVPSKNIILGNISGRELYK